MIIRKALTTDADAIADCMMLAMAHIVCQFVGEEHAHSAKSFLKHFILQKHNQYSYENCWVAEDEEGVVAAVNVYNGAMLYELRKPVAKYVREKYNIAFCPEDETSVGEYYVDTLGVKVNKQGEGIGSELLSFLIAEYVGRQGETLGLLVEKGNERAKSLYLKLGFRVVGTQTLVGEEMEHLQIKK